MNYLRLHITGTIAFLLLLSGCAHQSSLKDISPKLIMHEKDRAKWAFMSASLAENEGKLNESARYYKQVLKYDHEAHLARRHLVTNLIQLGRYKEAIAEYAILAKYIKEDQKIKYLLGQLHEATGNTEMAEAIYREAVEMGDEISGPSTRLGLILLRQDKTKKAIPFLKQALKIEPYDREARSALLKYYLSSDQWKKAMRLLEKGLKVEPNDIEWLANLARIAEVHKLDKAAVELYTKIIRIYPDYPRAYQFLSVYYLKQGEWQSAIQSLEKQLSQEPDNLLAKRNLGLAYFESAQIDKAQGLLYKLTKEHTQDALTHYLLGEIYKIKKHYYLAEHEFQQAIQLDAYLKESYLGLASVLVINNEIEKALDILYRASIKFNDQSIVLLRYGMLLIKAGKASKALKILNKAKLKNPDNSQIYFQIGRAYHVLKDMDMATFYWEKTLKIEPTFAEAYNHLGYMYAEKGIRLNTAIKLLKKAVSLEPNNGYYMDSLGWAYFKKKYYRKALREILTAKQTLLDQGLPVDPVIELHLGDVYFKLKAFEDARKQWQKVLEHKPDDKVLKRKLESIPDSGGKRLNERSYP